MPELPEVQTIVSDLKKVLPKLIVRDVWTDWAKVIKKPKSFVRFKKEIIGRKIISVERKGKNILIHLGGDRTVLIHQKMTGHMLYGQYKKSHFASEARGANIKNRKWTATKKGPLRDDPQNRFIHLVFTLSNGRRLALSDIRKFAKVLVFKTSEISELKDLKDVGPDPLSKSFSFEKFKEIISPKKGRIKDVLMKQELVSGIGNIYSNEILWEAGIYPFRKVETMGEKELRRVYIATRKILKKAVRLRGDSMVDYRDAFGEKGRYQEFHKAYQREGKKCPKNDGGIIKRVKKGGRSSFFCSVHQRNEK